MIELFWQIDLIGLLLLCASLALILLPFTLAGGVTRDWKQPHVLATLLVGFLVALPAFVVWETKVARHPLLPVKLFRDRTLLAGFCIGGVLKYVLRSLCHFFSKLTPLPTVVAGPYSCSEVPDPI